MSKYHVTWFYLATGMEGIADQRDYGLVEAPDKDTAIRQVMERENMMKHEEFCKSCLSAKEERTKDVRG